MKEKLLHTPEGVRDIYNSECKRKSAVEKRIHHILELYGIPLLRFSTNGSGETEINKNKLDELMKK